MGHGDIVTQTLAIIMGSVAAGCTFGAILIIKDNFKIVRKRG